MLIAMCVYNEDEARMKLTRRALESVTNTVDFSRHRLIISDNGSCQGALDLLGQYEHVPNVSVIYNGANIGAADAINRAWSHREPGEHCVKMDYDVVIHQPGWIEWIEDAFSRVPTLGILGLKRKDLEECPWSTNSWYKSRLSMLPHEKGQRWIVVEYVTHVMGTCQAYSSALLDQIGYLVQPGIYGFDDSLAAVRAAVAGFSCAFLCGFEIDHIDPGGDDHTEWKREVAGKDMTKYQAMKAKYRQGLISTYSDGGRRLADYLETQRAG